jgi:DNA-binding Lrp family transcriptional regulator
MARRVGVTVKALLQRVNRRLRENDQKVCRARSERVRLGLGAFYAIDEKRRLILGKDVNLEQVARELGALKPHEELESNTQVNGKGAEK